MSLALLAPVRVTTWLLRHVADRAIDLSHNNLRGTIPSTISNLIALT
jgi:hypothetical protein